MVSLMAMIAFALDYGYLLKISTDLQRTADASALAAVQDLIPLQDGSQDTALANSTVQLYAASNNDPTFVVSNSDIQIGRYDPTTVYSNFRMLNDGVLDTVKVKVRRDSQANAPVALFFARVLGNSEAGVSGQATAVLQRATTLHDGDAVLPIAIPQHVWDSQTVGEQWSVYGDGKITDNDGLDAPGNWGTVDIGAVNNSTSDISDQILNGLNQSHLDQLYSDHRILTNSHIDTAENVWVNADTGISSGVKAAVRAIHGQKRAMPIYDVVNGTPNGNNLEYRVVAWGIVKVVGSNWTGNKNTYIMIEKSYSYDGHLTPQSDLSNTGGVIQGAYTTPALVQ